MNIDFNTLGICCGDKNKDTKKDKKNGYSCNKNKKIPDSTKTDNNTDNKKDDEENKKEQEENQLKIKIDEIKNKFKFAKKIKNSFYYNFDFNKIKNLNELTNKESEIFKKITEADGIINNKKIELTNEINSQKNTYNNIFTKLGLSNFEIKKKDFNLSIDNFNNAEDLDDINKRLTELNEEINKIKTNFVSFFINKFKIVLQNKEGFDFIEKIRLVENNLKNLLAETTKLNINNVTEDDFKREIENIKKDYFSKNICVEIKEKNENKYVLVLDDKEYNLVLIDSVGNYNKYKVDKLQIDSLTYKDKNDENKIKFKKIYFRDTKKLIDQNKPYISFIYKCGPDYIFMHIVNNNVKLDEDVIKLNNFCNKATEIAIVDSYKNMTSFEKLFNSLKSLKLINLSNLNTENVINMKHMFNSCKSLENLNLSNFNTQNVTTMENMFSCCINLKSLNLSNFNTKKVTNMAGIFMYCENLESLDLKAFNTENVTKMGYMFYGLKSLKSLNLSSFNTQNVIDMKSMFESCKKLESLNLINFNTQKVTTMENMFKKCSNLKKNKVKCNDDNINKQLPI